MPVTSGIMRCFVADASEENTMSQFKTQQEAEEAGVYVRKIQSFVKREGRLTKGQAKAIEDGWPTMGLNHQKTTLDWSRGIWPPGSGGIGNRLWNGQIPGRDGLQRTG